MASFSNTIKEQIAGRNPKASVLVTFTFQSGPVRVWTGVGKLTANGQTWLGTGEYLSNSEIHQIIASAASATITFQVSGIAPSFIGLAVKDYEEGELDDARVELQLQFFDTDWQPLDSPITLFKGRMHNFSRSLAGLKGSQTATLAIEAINIFAFRSQPANSFLSDKDQQHRSSGDRMLERIPGLSDATIKFPDF